MKRAGDWRIGLRRQVLQSLSGLGRDPQMFQQRAQAWNELSRLARIAGISRSSTRLSGLNYRIRRERFARLEAAR